MPTVVSSDGAVLHYEIHGAGPQDVILLHGMGGTTQTWEYVLPLLDLGALRGVTMDFRAHGRSGGDPASFSYRQFDADILAVADAARCERSVLVGFSGAARNAAWLAAKHPERVRGLVLVAPPGFGVVPFPPEGIALFLNSLEQTGDVPAEFDPWFTRQLGARRAEIVEFMAATPRATLEGTVKLWIETAIETEIANVTCPVHVIAGTQEPIYNPTFQRETTLRTLPHATLEEVDCPHFIPWEKPEAIAAAIMRVAGKLSPEQFSSTTNGHE